MCEICEAKDRADAAEAELSFRLRQHVLELSNKDEVAATRAASSCRALVEKVITEQSEMIRLFHERGSPKRRASH